MGLIEKIGSAACNLTSDPNVCLLRRVSPSAVAATCVIGAFPLLTCTKTNTYTGGASAAIDRDAAKN